jgi:hypothetical protein
MNVSHRFSPIVAALLALALALLVGSPGPSAQARPEGPRTNRCGCFEESPGVCKCLRRSRCGCPGECEPLGCEEKRQKDLARRMEQELKKIRDDERERQEPGVGGNDEPASDDGDGDGDGGRDGGNSRKEP